MSNNDIVRIFRIIEYVGPRERVEATVASSIHGSRDAGRGLVIRASTLGAFPESVHDDVELELVGLRQWKEQATKELEGLKEEIRVNEIINKTLRTLDKLEEKK